MNGSRPFSFWKRHGASYLFLAPFLVMFTAFYVVPVLVSMGMSVTYYNLLQPARWIGLANYRNLFLADDVFLIAVGKTLLYAVITGPLGFLLAFLFAWLITSTGRARVTYTLIFYAPAISGGMTQVWMLIFAGDRYGILNTVLTSLGVIDDPVIWLRDPRYIMAVIMVVSLWMSMGTGFLAQMAGLQSIPSELYEAGRIDGIPNRWYELWYITLPMCRPYLLVAAVLQVVVSFNVFQVSLSLAGLPSTGYAGHTIVAHLYDYAFKRFELGYAAAIAMVLFAVTYGLNRLLVRLLSTEGEL